MAINKKLIHFQTLANFNAQLSAGNILDTSIVFIKDAKKIWTHGQLYDCSGGGGAESPVYVTDFTFADCNKNIDIESLVDAVVKCKPILVPFDSENSGFSTVVSRKIDDEYVTLYCYLSPEYNPVNDKGGEFVFNYLRDTGELDEALFIPLPDRLVSGTNIKTINGESILGRGNITIQGGSGGGSAAYPIVNHGTSDTTFTLTPNTFHVWGEVSSLDLSFGAEQVGVANEYLFQFTSGPGGTTLALPGDIKWANDLRVDTSYTYQVSILNGIASSIRVFNPLSGTDPA